MFWELLLLAFVHYSLTHKTLICDTEREIKFNGNLNNAEIVFIQSPGFPRSMNQTDRERCKFQITVDNPNQGKVIRLVITNGVLTSFIIKNGGDVSVIDLTAQRNKYLEELKQEPTTLYFSKYGQHFWNGFQGYVMYEHIETCPFSITPFTFENESQTVYLQYPFTYIYTTNATIETWTCNWVFKGPKGYGFKLVHLSTNPKEINLSAFNSTGYDIVRGYGLKENQKYYNGDNYLNITASFENFDGKKKFFFTAYVSIVKNQWNTKDPECRLNIREEENIAIWSNGKSGYPNNAECNITIPIPHNSFIDTRVLSFNVEPYVDYIDFIDTSGEIYHMNILPFDPRMPIYDKKWAFFESFSNERNIAAKFVSDGSIQNDGFLITFETIECTCAPEIITVPCNRGLGFPILNETSMYICPNTICKFKIKLNETCPTQFILLRLQPSTLGKIYGVTVFIDNQVYFNSSEFETINTNQRIISLPSIPLLPKEDVELSFFSLKQKARVESHDLSFMLTPINASVILETVKLSSDQPTYKIDFVTLPNNSILTVELSDDQKSNGDFIEMYFTEIYATSCLLLYKNEKLEKITNQILELVIPPYKISSNTSITIYKSHCRMSTLMPALFRAKKEHSKNCIFTNNIYNNCLNVNIIRRGVSAMSAESGECEVVLMGTCCYHIDRMWTNSKTGKISMFTGSSNTTDFDYNFNKSDITDWENIELGSNFYTFVVPPKSSLYIEVTWSRIINKIDKAPMKLFLDTRFFGTFFEYIPTMHQEDRNGAIAKYEIQDIPTIFEVQIFDLSPEAQLYVTDSDNNTFNFDHKGQTRTFENTIITVYHYEMRRGSHAGARLFIYTKL